MWGILGLGKIASRMANDVMLSDNVALCDMGSKDINRAKAFAQKYNAVKFFDSYEEQLFIFLT